MLASPAMGFVIIGRRLYGKIAHHDKSCVATQMAHINFFPLVPERTFVVFHDSAGRERAFAIPRDRRSLAAVYLRWWSFLVAGGSIFLFAAVPSGSRPFVFAAGLALWIALLVWGLRIGRLTATERRQRHFYAQLTGVPVDPRHLVVGGFDQRADIQRTLASLGGSIDAGTYRHRHDPRNDWGAIALDAGMQSPAYLIGALTLARLEMGAAPPERRTQLAAMHDAIWQKLAATSTEDAVDWTEWRNAEMESADDGTDRAESRAASEAMAPASPPGPQYPVYYARQPGRSFEDGWDVEIDPRAYRAPQVCASCRGPALRTLVTKRWGTKLDVPYCSVCVQQADAGWNNNRGRHLQFFILFGAGVFGVVGLIPGLPLVGACALAMLTAVAGAVALLAVAPVQKLPLPATATIEGARLVKTGKGRATLFCTDREWATWLAAQHGSVATPRCRPNRSVFVIPRYALFAPPLAAFFAWSMANPEVHVDNGFHEPIQLWIDGRPSVIVNPSTKRDGGQPTTVRVAWGNRMLGWSHVGASAPEHTTAGKIDVAGNHLYVPGALLCHYLDVVLYGNEHTYPGTRGPVPIEEFHTFPRVNSWFTENPPSIESKSGGESRVAVRRWEACEYIASPPCPEGERARYWECVRQVWESEDQKQVDRCEKAMAEACGFVDEPPSPPASKAAAP